MARNSHGFPSAYQNPCCLLNAQWDDNEGQGHGAVSQDPDPSKGWGCWGMWCHTGLCSACSTAGGAQQELAHSGTGSFLAGVLGHAACCWFCVPTGESLL